MKNVLIVEDSIFVANAIKILLENEGLNVEVTKEGAKVKAVCNTKCHLYFDINTSHSHVKEGCKKFTLNMR